MDGPGPFEGSGRASDAWFESAIPGIDTSSEACHVPLPSATLRCQTSDRPPLRRSLLLTALVATAVTMSALPAVAGAPKAKPGSGTLRASMAPGQTAWISIDWKGGAESLSDVRFRVVDQPAGYEIAYPTAPGDGTYTSLHVDDVLDRNERDVARVRVTVPQDASKDAKLTFELTYRTPDGSPGAERYDIKIPIEPASGGPFTQIDDAVSVTGSGWVQVRFRGERPDVNDVATTVSAPAGVNIVYPGERSSTSLYRDARLDQGETDFVAFFVEAPAGTHTLTLETAWSGGPPVTTSLTLEAS